MNPSTEPVRLAGLVLAFCTALINLVAFVLDWSGEVVSLVNIVVAAAIAVVAEVVRMRVTPVQPPPGP